MNSNLVAVKYLWPKIIDGVSEFSSQLFKTGNRVVIEYVDLCVKYYLESSIALQFSAFSKGFNTVCGGQALGVSISRNAFVWLCMYSSLDQKSLSFSCVALLILTWPPLKLPQCIKVTPRIPKLWSIFGRSFTDTRRIWRGRCSPTAVLHWPHFFVMDISPSKLFLTGYFIDV